MKWILFFCLMLPLLSEAQLSKYPSRMTVTATNGHSSEIHLQLMNDDRVRVSTYETSAYTEKEITTVVYTDGSTSRFHDISSRPGKEKHLTLNEFELFLKNLRNALLTENGGKAFQIAEKTCSTGKWKA